MLRNKGKSIKNYTKIGSLHFSNFPHLTALITRPLGRGRSLISIKQEISNEIMEEEESQAKIPKRLKIIIVIKSVVKIW